MMTRNLCETYLEALNNADLAAVKAPCSAQFLEKLTNEHEELAFGEFTLVDFYHNPETATDAADDVFNSSYLILRELHTDNPGAAAPAAFPDRPGTHAPSPFMTDRKTTLNRGQHTSIATVTPTIQSERSTS